MPSFDTVCEPEHGRSEERRRKHRQGNRHALRLQGHVRGRIELKDKEITLFGDADFQLGQVMDILLAKLTKRNVDVRFLDKGDDREDRRRQGQAGAQGAQTASRASTAKKIQQLIKDSKLKVQAAIQGDAVRVTGAKRDDLQAAMALIRKEIDRRAAVLQQLPRLSREALSRRALAAGCACAAAQRAVGGAAGHAGQQGAADRRRRGAQDGGAPATRTRA